MDFLHQQETQQKKIEKLETSADAVINKAEEEFATNILKIGLNFLSVDKPVKQQLKEIGSDIISVGGLKLNNPILTTTALFNRQQGRLTKSAKDLAVATLNYIVDRKGERQEYIDNIKQQINNDKKNTLYGFEVDENNNILNKKGLEGVKIKEDDNNLYFFDRDNKLFYQRKKKREYEINFKKDFTKTELEEMRKAVPRYSKMSDQQWQEYINKPHKRNVIIDEKLAQQLTPMISTISEETINDWQMAKPMGVLEYLETLTRINKMKPALNNIAIKIRTGERLTDEEIETLKEYKTREAETMYRGVSFAGKLLPSIETDLEVQAKATIDSYYAHKLTKAGLKGWKPQSIRGRIGKYFATVGLNVIGTYITSKITDKTPIANIGAGNDRQKLLEKYRSNVLQLSDKGEMILNKNYSQEKENFFKYQTTIENLGEIISEEILDAPMEALGAWIDNKILGGAIEKLGGKYNILQKIYLGAKKINSIPNTFGTTFDSLATEHLEELAGMTFKYLMKANDPDSTLVKEIQEYRDDFLLSTANILIAGGLFRAGVGALTGDNSRQSNDSLSGLVLKRYLKENTNLKEEEINHKVNILAESTKDKLLDQLYQKEDAKSKEKYENKLKELETNLTEERGEEEAKNQMALLDVMAGGIARKMGVSRYDIIEGYKQEFSDSKQQWEEKRNKNDEILYNETIIKNKFIQDALKDVKVEDVKLDLTTEFNSLVGQSKNDMSKAIEKQLKNLIEKSFNTGTPPYKIQILGKKVFLVGNKKVSINLKEHIKDSNLSLKKQQLKNHNGALLSLEKIINNSTTNGTTEPINNKQNKWKIKEYKKTLEGARYFKSFFKVGDNYFLVKLTTFLNEGQEDKNISDLYNVAVTPLELTNSREFAPISATTIESIDTQQQKSSNILNQEEETTFNQNDINNQPITIENTFKDYKDIKDLIAQAKEYYRDNLQGTYIEREDIGKVYFTKTGIDKTINSSRGHPIIMQTIPYLKDIIKSGKILNNEDLKKETKDKELIGYIGLKNNINTERGEYNIIALLQKRNDGNYYYTNYLKIKEGADPLNPKRAGAINTHNSITNKNIKVNSNNETIYNQMAPTEKKEIETLENQKEEIEKQLQEFEEENEEIEKRNKEIYKEELNNLNQQYRSKEEAIKKIEEKKEELKKETDEKIEDFKKEVKETKNETMKFKMELKYYDFKTELEDRLNKKLKELAEKKDKLVQEQDEILNNKYKILDRNKEILHKEWEEKNEEYENIKQQIIETKFGKKPKSNNYFYTYKEFAERFLKEGDTSIPLYEYDGYVDEDKGYYIYDDGEKIFINDFLPISKEDYYNKLVDKNPQYSFNKLNNREYNKAQKALQLYSHLMVDNHKLRKGEETERARIVQKAIDNQYIPNEKILYRGLQKSEYTNKIKQMKVGESFEEKAFSSTSQSKEVAERFTDDEGAMLIIKTPARKFGVGIYVEGVGNLFANDENEFLLNKGTFTITKKDGNNIYVDFKPKTDKNKLIITHELELKKMESILNNKNLLVAPSLAIQRAEKSGDNRYGEIKLIGSKELITGEKYKNTKVYKTDSYTPALFHSNYDIKKINGKEALVKYDDNGEVVTIEPYTPEKQLEILKQQKNSENATKDLGREITEEDIKTIELDKNKDIRQQLEEQGANLERYAEGKIMDLVSLKDFQGAIMPNTKEYDKVANKLEQLGLTVKRVDYNDVYGELDKEQYNKALEDIENEQQVLFQRQLNNTLDLTDEFKHKPTFKEVKEYIETLIETARQFTTLNPDWLIDIKKEPSRNKQERITKKILNYGNFKNLNRTQQERYNNYILQLEKILNNATYTGEQPNNKQGQKPQVEKYHYFTSNIKVGNNYYKIILDAEQYKGENETKPQVVHLYNISEIKTSPDANDLSGHIIGQRGLLDNSITNNNQNVKGNIVFNRDYSEAIINLFRDKADQSTLLHENMHFFEKTIERYARKGYPVAQQMYNEIKKAVGETEQYMRVEKSEDLARWYEQYIRTGKYQNPILKNVYDYFRDHLLKIYEKASDLNIDINNPELYKFFDKYIFSPTKYVNDSDWLYKLHTEGEDDKQQESKEETTEKILDDEIPLFETILKQSDDVEELAKAVQEYVEKLKEKGLTKEDALKDAEFIKLANEYLEKIKKNLEENPLTERREVELYNNELQDIISNLAPNETKTINIRGKNIEIDNSIFDLIKNNNLSYNEFYKGLNNLDYGVIIQETPEQTTLTDNEGLKTILTKQGENYRITEIDNGRQKQEIKQSAITIEKTFKNYKDIKDLVAQAKEYYKNNLQGTYIEREDIGIIEFTREGIEKTINISKGHPDLMQIIPQLKELVKSGEFVAEEKLNKIRKDKTKSFIAIYNNIKLDDKNKSILILLKRTDNGKYYYTSYLDLDNKNSYRELQKKDSVPLILEKEGDDRTYDNDNKKKLIVNSRVRKTTGETESDFKARRQREFIENYNKNVNTTEELPKYTPLNLEENDKRTALEKLRDYINKIFSKSTAEEEKYFKELLKEKNLAIEEFNKEIDLEEADPSLKMKPYKNIQELIDKYERGERQATDLEGNYYGNQGLETQNATILSSEEYNKVVNFRKIYMKENIEKVQEQLTEGSKQLKKAEKQLQEERYKNNRQADIIEKQQQKLNDLNQLLKTDINTYKEVQDALGIIKDPTLKFKIMKYSNSRSPEYVIKKINEYKQKELRNDYQRVIDEILNSTTYISRRTGKEYGNVIYEDTKFFKELKAINKYSQKQASMELVKLQEQRDKGENTEPQLEYDTKKQLLYFKANSEISPDNMNKIIYNLGKITDIAKEKLNEVKKASFIDVISERKQVRELISNTEKATPHMINKATDKGNWKTLLELIGGKKLAEKFDVLPNEMIMASNLKNKQDVLFNKMFNIFSGDKQQQEKQLLKYFEKLEGKVTEVKYKNTLESGNISESFNILETKENFEDLKTMIIRKLENINNPTATKLKDYVETTTAKYRKGTQNTYKHQLNNTDYLNILDALSFIEYSGAGDQETEALEKQLQKTLTKNHNADFLKYEINGWNLLYYNLLKRNKATNNLIKRYYDEKTVQQLDNLTKEQGKEFKELEQILFESVQDWEELNPYFIVEFNRDLGRAENYFPRRSIHEDEVGMFDLLYNSNNDRDKTISAIERRSLNAIPNLAQNPLSLALSHQAQTEFTKNIAPRLRDFINIFNQDLQKEIAEKYGEKTRNALNVFLQSFKEKGFVNQPTAIEKTTSIIINNWARSVTNTPSVFLKQVGSHIFYSYDLTAGEMVQFYKNLFKGVITPKKTFEFMKEISPYIKQRLDDQQYRQFLEAIKKKEKKENKSLAEKTSEFINELEIPFLEFIKWGDIFSVVYGGYARYHTDLENGKTKEEALKNFERLTTETQQSKFTSLQAMRDLKNREVAEGRLSSMFRSQDIQLLNKQMQRELEYNNKDSTKQERINRILTQNILNPVMQTLIIRTLINALYGRSRDKEKITLDLLTAILLSFFMPSTLVPATVIGLSRIFRTENLFTKKDAPLETLLTMISIGTKLPVENFYKIFFKRETEKQKKKNENKSTEKKALESLFDNY